METLVLEKKTIRKSDSLLSVKEKRIIKDLHDAFNDVKLHQKGLKKLKTAKELLNEI